ncbi:hypothetical protein OEA41_002742 [Lepraria neglecta]|uniref:Uncharacterized protein n=1 Tax=Lepraria neglecta TaxID=209136 RepID=A0AAD9Z328_9LECA|nr:hypothetical protein OEA41_002742 [Lepraria neglecta]
MLFTRAFIVSALAALASAQAATTVSPAQESKAVNDLSSYLNALTTDPGYTAAVAAFATAVPSDVLSEIEDNPDGYFQSAFTATALPTWFTALPSSAQSFFSSVGAAEISIVSKDVKGPAPTNAVKVGGAVLAAGGAVLALL